MAALEAYLEFQNVRFGYTEKPILKDLSLAIGKAERVALIGPNGCGKTTLVRLALGLEIPTSGATFLFGQRASWDTHVPQLGYIGDPKHSEDGLGLPLWLTTEQMVMTYRQMLKTEKVIKFERTMFERLEIAALSGKTVKTLSAGERRRLMVYLAISKGPRLLISDEATEVVYEEQRPALLQCILDCCKEFETAVFWVSHDVDSTATIADKVYVLMPHGQVEELKEATFSITISDDERSRPIGLKNQREVIPEFRKIIKESTSTRLQFTLERSQGQE